MEPSVTVTGLGQALAVPDQAGVRLAAVHRAPGVADAYAGAESTVEAITDIARRHTDERRIATTGLTVWPATDRDGRPEGWECRHGLLVVVADLASAGTLVGELAATVGERMVLDGVELSVSDPGTALAEAREGAMADARRRAADYARLGSRALGDVLRVVEGAAPDDGALPVAAARSMAMKDASLAPGERTITAAVTVTWALA